MKTVIILNLLFLAGSLPGLVEGSTVCEPGLTWDRCLSYPSCVYVLATLNDEEDSRFLCADSSASSAFTLYAKFRTAEDCLRVGDIEEDSTPLHIACTNGTLMNSTTAGEKWENLASELREPCPAASPIMIALFVVIVILAIVLSVSLTFVFLALRDKSYDVDFPLVELPTGDAKMTKVNDV